MYMHTYIYIFSHTYICVCVCVFCELRSKIHTLSLDMLWHSITAGYPPPRGGVLFGINVKRWQENTPKTPSSMGGAFRMGSSSSRLLTIEICQKGDPPRGLGIMRSTFIENLTLSSHWISSCVSHSLSLFLFLSTHTLSCFAWPLSLVCVWHAFLCLSRERVCVLLALSLSLCVSVCLHVCVSVSGRYRVIMCSEYPQLSVCACVCDYEWFSTPSIKTKRCRRLGVVCQCVCVCLWQFVCVCVSPCFFLSLSPCVCVCVCVCDYEWWSNNYQLQALQ